MTLGERIHRAEADLFHAVGAEVEESFLDLANTGLRVRLLAHGSGPPVVLLHGVSLSAAAWAPLFNALGGLDCSRSIFPVTGCLTPTGTKAGTFVSARAC